MKLPSATLLFAALLLTPPVVVGQQSPPAAASTPTPAPDPLAALKSRVEQATLENNLREQQLRQELSKLADQKARLELEAAVRSQQQAREAAEMQTRIDAAAREAELLSRELSAAEARQKLEITTKLGTARAALEELKLQGETAAAQNETAMRDLQKQMQELLVQEKQVALQRAQLDMNVAKFRADIELWQKRDEWRNFVNREITYSKEPYRDGILTISDRRIALNGVITYDTADYVTERLAYYNNQSSEYPVFLVIDTSPGGSVMAGYRILKAMQGSAAPVYVVVKSLAASMAAVITTLAPRSFAYPNALFVQHQILGGSSGNLTEQRENVRMMEEWWKRLAAPVAAKMGIPLDDFVKQMYENRSTGDWIEFADRARQLKWVDQIVEEVREESYVKNPDLSPAPDAPPSSRPPGGPIRAAAEEAGVRSGTVLPRLSPLDGWFLFNPDGHYRAQ